MNKPREPIGDIKCPLCQRDAELHQFTERTKLNPDSEGGGKPTYPKKFFVICPPVKGYRGCGTILANGAEAQGRLMDLGRVFGAAAKEARAPEPSDSRSAQRAGSHEGAAAPVIPPTPAKPAPSANPFKLW